MRLYAADMVLTIEFGVNACCLNMSVNEKSRKQIYLFSAF